MKTLILAALLAQPTSVAGDAIQPHLVADGAGNLYCTFIRNGNIEISVSTDGGKSFSRPVTAINANGKARGGLQRGPRIAVDSKKNIYITAPLCFDQKEFSRRYPRNDLYLAVSTNGGKTFAKPIQVNDLPKKAPESLHWMGVAADGTVHVAWLDMRQGNGQRLAYARITGRGRKVSRTLLLAGPLCECCAPGLAVDSKGNPLLAYREGGTKKSRAIYFGMSARKGSSFSRFIRVNKGETRVPS